MLAREELEVRLRDLSGDILARTKEDHAALSGLEKALLDADLAVSPKASLLRELSIDRASRDDPHTLPADRLLRLKRLAEQADLERQPRYRVFRREAPVASATSDLAAPDWGGGAAIDKTLGPFESRDGRRYWFDFYPVATLVPLYLAGQTTPAALVNLDKGKRRSDDT
jgi:hypothetical protein